MRSTSPRLTAVVVLAAALVALVCGAGPLQTAAQQCVPFSSVLSDGSLSFCAGIVPEGSSVYLPAGVSSQLQAEGALIRDTLVPPSNPSLAKLLPLIPPRCTAAVKRTTCSSVFQPCKLVDPYYLDSTCTNSITDTCVTHPTNATHSMCKETGGGTYGDGQCSSAPGRIAGQGNVTWAAAHAANANVCTAYGLQWDAAANTCAKPMPRSPCVDLCNRLQSINSTIVGGELVAECPLVSGVFLHVAQVQIGLTTCKGCNSGESTTFGALLAAIDPVSDPFVVQQLTAEIEASQAGKPACSNATQEVTGACFGTSKTGRVNLNLLSLLGLLPNCQASASGVFVYSDTYTGEALPSRAASAGAIMELQAGRAGQLASTVFADHHVCFAGYDAAVVPDPGLGFIDDLETKSEGGILPDMCVDVVKGAENSPSSAELQILAAMTGRTVEEAKGLFFVPPWLGLPLLPHQFTPAGQPAPAAPLNAYMQQPKEDQSGVTPLCSVGDGEYRGYSSLECLLQKAESAAGLFPGYVAPRCQVAFAEFLCSTAFMKVVPRTLCLAPGGCASSPVAGAANRNIGLPLALPRFPDQRICTNMQEECGDFIGYVIRSRPELADAVRAATACNGTVNLSCDDNSEWATSVWPCESSFNGLDSYPEEEQNLLNFNQLGDAGALLDSYAVGFLTNLEKANMLNIGKVATQNRTITYNESYRSFAELCSCPAPLVVPENPDYIGSIRREQGFVCCEQPCISVMYTAAEVDVWGQIQFSLSLLSLIMSGFIFITWSTFKAKRKQQLTLWFSVTSICVALTFIVIYLYSPEPQDTFCKNNAEPNVQEDGGMCLLQSILVTVFPLAACGWWWCQAFDLYLKVVRNQRHLHLMPLYHAISWGVPIIIVCIYAGLDLYGYAGPNPWCFLNEKGEDYELIFFYGWVALCMCTGGMLMFAVILSIFRVTRKSSQFNRQQGGGNSNVMKRLAAYRCVSPLLCFAYVCVWLCALYGDGALLPRRPIAMLTNSYSYDSQHANTLCVLLHLYLGNHLWLAVLQRAA